MDSIESVEALGAALAGTAVELVVEIDSGHHRSGVAPADAAKIATAIASAGLEFAGVFTFPGHSYSPDGRTQAARDEAEAIAEATAVIERAGLEVRVRSGGSTPTWAKTDSTVLTEMRPGVHLFNDAQQAELGSCGWKDIALTARTTVVSITGRNVVVDAGSKILGADRAAWATGFGRLPEHPDARIVAISEHHATVQFAAGVPLPVRGSTLQIAPNHACAAVNLVDELWVEVDGEIVDFWPVAARGANS